MNIIFYELLFYHFYSEWKINASLMRVLSSIKNIEVICIQEFNTLHLPEKSVIGSILLTTTPRTSQSRGWQ